MKQKQDMSRKAFSMPQLRTLLSLVLSLLVVLSFGTARADDETSPPSDFTLLPTNSARVDEINAQIDSTAAKCQSDDPQYCPDSSKTASSGYCDPNCKKCMESYLCTNHALTEINATVNGAGGGPKGIIKGTSD